ncbi:AAA family ATPase [Pseudonocardia acidicola]|uniref:AAA family ATPase n=1 Tax=Pseudonocardia acidicola TaxID=2724939 RepID=A0ABX1SDG5_9PSEU|nr:AAA family ATPase [Pseudonocardia acidicola]NMH98897.1 AAA family ATPase [Pseudonocardia acidicola]
MTAQDGAAIFERLARQGVGVDRLRHATLAGTGQLQPVRSPRSAPRSSTPGNGEHPDRDDAPKGRHLRVTRASQVAMRRARWLWDGRIVVGGLSLLAGREGLGKSTIAVELVAQVTRGKLDGEFMGQPRNVIYINSEDARDYTIVPRLLAAGADLDRVIFLDAISPTEDGDITASIVLPVDGQLLAEVITECDAALVVLDAATSVLDSRLDGDKDRAMRIGLERIARIGEETSAAVLGIVHFGKRESSDTGKLILGSIAWSQVARSVLAVARDPETEHLIISREKGNLGRPPASLAVQIVSASVSTPEGTADVGRAQWLGETDQRASDLLGASESEGRVEQNTAEAWLSDYLEENRKAPSRDVKRAARGADISERTLQRARVSLGVVVTNEGFPRVSIWSLPDSRATGSGSGARARESGTTGTTGSDQGKCKPPFGATADPRSPVVPVVPAHMREAQLGLTGATQPHPGLWRVSGEPIDDPEEN